MTRLASLLKHGGTLLLAGIAFYLGTMAGASAAAAVGLPSPGLPEGVDAQTLGLFLAVSALLVPMVLAPISRHLAVPTAARWLILATLAWVTLGINTALEALIFSPGQAALGFSAVTYLVAAAACAGVVARAYPPAGPVIPFTRRLRGYLSGRAGGEWALRGLLALAAFPLIYTVFGLAVRPFVEPYYAGGALGLRVPGWDVLLPMLTVRSAFFLLACTPVLVAWEGSVQRLLGALGVGLFMLVGGIYMIQSYWLPAAMRAAHAAEILADSWAYAAAIIVLLRPPEPGAALAGRGRPSVRAHQPAQSTSGER